MSFSFIYVHYINIIKYYRNVLTLEKRNAIIKTVKENKQTEVRTMTKINIKQFIALMDGAQDEDTEIVINVDGEEMAVGTLEEAQTNMIQSLDMYSPLIVKSFVFCHKSIVIECEL